MTRTPSALTLALGCALAFGVRLADGAPPGVLEGAIQDEGSAEAAPADDSKGDESNAEPATRASEVKRPAPSRSKDAVVADFGDAAGAAQGAGPRRMSFTFESAPWKLVLDLFAKDAGLTLDMMDTEVPPGTFTYHDSKSYTPTEALDIINGYLLKRGYLLIRRDRFLVVVNIDNQIPPNLIPQISVEELPKRGRYELLTVVLPLNDIDAKTANEEIKDMLGPQGKSQPLAATNRLLVTDVGENLQIIYRSLQDMAAIGDDKSQTFRAFKLINISATEAEIRIRELFGMPPRGQFEVCTPNCA